jgi:hypothetical protein
MQPYRPVNLTHHVIVGELYEKVRDTGPEGGHPTAMA